MTEREMDTAMRCYEGLVKRTAQLLVAGTHPIMTGRLPIEMELEDVEQLLRIKVFRGLQAFDPSKARRGNGKNGRSPRDLYINMVVQDQVKDIAKKRRLGHLFIEDVAPARGGHQDLGPRDAFDQRYLAESHEQTFGRVEEPAPLIPSTLSERERDVVLLLYRDFRQTEIAGLLGLTKREVESVMRQVRAKLADWKPSPPADPQTDETSLLEQAPSLSCAASTDRGDDALVLVQ